MKRRDFLTSCLVVGGGVLIGKKSYGLEFFPKPSDKKWAILFGIKYGSTRDASIWISEGMGGIADVFDVREKPALDQFQHVIIGSGIYYGKIAPSLEKYLSTNLKTVKDKVKGFFIVCGAGASYGTRYITLLEKACGIEPQHKKVFSGRITKKLLSEEDYKALENYNKINNRLFEDYDRLIRKECLLWGERIHKSSST